MSKLLKKKPEENSEIPFPHPHPDLVPSISEVSCQTEKFFSNRRMTYPLTPLNPFILSNRSNPSFFPQTQNRRNFRQNSKKKPKIPMTSASNFYPKMTVTAGVRRLHASPGIQLERERIKRTPGGAKGGLNEIQQGFENIPKTPICAPPAGPPPPPPPPPLAPPLMMGGIPPPPPPLGSIGGMKFCRIGEGGGGLGKGKG